MDDAKKNANMMRARDIMNRALLEALKQVAKETGAIQIRVDATMLFDAVADLGGGGAGILLVYPQAEKPVPADPAAIAKQVEEMISKTSQVLKRRQGSGGK